MILQHTHQLFEFRKWNYLHVLKILVAPPRDEIPQPCHPSPCGSNAICTERNGAGACACLPDYIGDPYSGCRPECVTNNDCPSHRACLNNKCKDPCPGVYGPNAECRVLNHSPQCNCLIGFTGNPLSACHPAIEPPSTKFVIRTFQINSISQNSLIKSIFSIFASPISVVVTPCRKWHSDRFVFSFAMRPIQSMPYHKRTRCLLMFAQLHW